MANMANMANNKAPVLTSVHPFSRRCTHFHVVCSPLCSYPGKKMANMANNSDFYEKCYRKLYKQVQVLSRHHATLLRLHVSTEVAFVCLIVAVRTLFHFAWLKPTPFPLFTFDLSKKTFLLKTTLSI